MLELRLLGRFTASLDGRPLEFQLRRSQSLLAYLVLSAGTAHRREMIAGLFWPDADEPTARSNLRHTLWRLRKVLEPVASAYLLIDDLSVQFDPKADYWLDTAELERKMDENTSIEALISAVSVYQGELLPGFYEEWVIRKRERLAAVFEQKMQLLLNKLVIAERWNEVLEWGERWIALGSTPEPAYRALMIAHGGLNNLSEVAHVYQRCSQALDAELDVLPSEQTQLVYERLVHGESPAVLAAASTFQGRYHLDEVIGRGGMGIVYQAQDTLLAREVAVKILQPGHLGTEGRVHWLHEAQTIARLNHPNVLTVYDAGEARLLEQNQPLPYIVMELAEGVTLRDYSPQSVEEALAIGRQICAALEEAHANGVIHGDIKPENVIVGPHQIIKLMDFGLARVADATTTGVPNQQAMLATLPGTIPYLAPEVLEGHGATVQSDLFSLGVLLYEMVTGRLPFSMQDLSHTEVPDPPSVHNPQLTKGFDALIGRLLAREAADRPQSAAEVQQALLELKTALDQRPAPGDAPFLGLSYFDEADAGRFFGRELLTARLVNLVREDDCLAVVIGASGSGKSSILRAGLIATLRQEKPLADGTLSPSGSRNWRYVVVTPTAEPLTTLAEALVIELGAEDEEIDQSAILSLRNDMRADPLTLLRFVNEQVDNGSISDSKPLSKREATKKAVATNYTHPHSLKPPHLFIAVDQFEELFTLCRDERERRAYIDNLLTAAEAGGGATVVIVLRADFYAHCAQYANLRQAVARRQEYIGPMNSEELRRAIEEPARQAEWDFEPGLVDLILRDVGDEPGALPLLSHALLETWRRRRGRTLTLAGYAAAGGVQGAIAQTAEGVYQSLSAEEKVIARRIFLRLTELGEGTAEGGLPSPDTRRRVSLDELIPSVGETSQTEAVLQKLVEARLVVVARETAEVAHEALIREWPALRQWLSRDREGLLLYRQLTNAAHDWEASDGDPSFLYQGARLEQTQEWVALHPGELNPLEQLFLNASEARAAEQKAQAAEQQRQAEQLEMERRTATRLRRLRNTLGVALLLAAVAALLFFNQLQEASRQREAAETARLLAEENESLALVAQQEEQAARQEVETLNSRLLIEELVAQSAVILEESPPLSHLLALEALHISDQSGTEALDTAALESQLRFTLAHTAGRALAPHLLLVRAVALSPDGRWLATASDDGTARLWDISRTSNFDLNENLQVEPLVLRGHEGVVRAVAFSPDSHWLVTTSTDSTIHLWNLTDLNADPVILRGHEAGVNELSFSPNGRWLATVSEDGTARLWDMNGVVANSGESAIVLRGHEGAVWCLAFSPDGRWLATGSSDNTARLWNIESLDSAGGGDFTGESVILSGHEGPIRSVAFSPDGRRLATGSRDNTVRLWELADPASITSTVLGGHTHWLRKVLFSPNGRWLATASRDTTVRLWDLSGDLSAEPDVLRGHSEWVRDEVFSPDSRWLATAAWDGTIQLWDLTGEPEERPIVLLGHESGANAVAFSPDGRLLASGGRSGSVRLWGMGQDWWGYDPWAEPAVLRDHVGWVYNAVFSPDGRWLATGGQDRVARLWDVTDPQARPIILGGYEAAVLDMAFSADSRWLATGSGDGFVRLWPVGHSEAEPIRLDDHQSPVTTVAFSPDDRLLATGGDDSITRLWSLAAVLADGEAAEPLIELSHPDDVLDADFSADGRWLATGNKDGTVQIWELSTIFNDEMEVIDSAPEPLILPGHTDWAKAVAFSADGRWLATASLDRTVLLWDLTGLAEAETAADLPTPLVVRGYQGPIQALTFSDDGRWLATGSDDSMVRLWRLEELTSEVSDEGVTTARPVILRDRENFVRAVAFSPDGSLLAAASQNGNVRLWHLSLDELVEVACARAGRNFSREEWQLYFPNREYRLTCPQWAEYLGEPEQSEGD